MFLFEVSKFIGDSGYVIKRTLVVTIIFLCSACSEFLFVTNTNDFISSLVDTGSKEVDRALPKFLFLLVVATVLKGVSLFSLNHFVQFMRVRLGGKLIYGGMEANNKIAGGHTVAVLSNELDNLIGYYFLPLFNIVFSLLTLLAVVFAALSEYPLEGAMVLGVGALSYIFIYFTTRRTIKYNGEIRSIASMDRIGFLTAVLPISLLFNLNSNTISVAKKYNEYNRKISKAFFLNSFLSVIPKHLLEFVGLCSIAVAFYLNTGSEAQSVTYYIPMIGTLMVVSVRILPPMQLIFQNYNQLLFAGPIISKVQEVLTYNKPDKMAKPHNLHVSILTIKNVNTCLPHGSYINGNKIHLCEGKIFQICGPSGSGKTTLLQAIALQDARITYADSDNLPVDPRSLRVGYSLQNNSFFPGSIYENITLDLDGSLGDSERLRKIISICQLESLLQRSNLSIFEKIGSNSKDLSGGEKQRIALARALFNSPNLLLIDEGTSGIEGGLEAEILKDILINFPRTIVVVTSHRDVNHPDITKVHILHSSL